MRTRRTEGETADGGENVVVKCLVLLVSLLLFFSPTAVGESGGGGVVVRSDRPRVLFDSADLAKAKQSLQSYGKDDFQAIYRYALRRVASTPPEKLAASGCDPKLVASVALAGILAQDDMLLRLAIDYALAMAATPPGAGDDTVQRNRLLSLAYLYDWLQERLTPPERVAVREGIVSHIRHLRAYLDDPLYSGGHSRYGSAVIMAGLIALSESDWPGERARLLEVVRREWERGYNPFQGAVAAEGGYHMGWRYGPAYTDPLPYLLWEKGTGRRWGEAWRANQIYWLIYGVRGDGTFPRTGDCWDVSLQDDSVSAIAALSSGTFGNRYGEWFYRRYLSDDWEPRRFYRLLFRDPRVVPLDPADAEAPLPLAQLFAGAGFVVARDGWDRETTQLVFKSAPFYSRNHHHKDQNHFELSYRGSLMTDSGVYDAFGSSHWKNYYSRTVAHNTLIVYDPQERFVDGSLLANDGGQRFVAEGTPPVGREPLDLEEARSNKYRMGGITGFGDGKGIVWMRGDASRAYDSKKVVRYLRDILMVNRPAGRAHPMVLVVDRVTLAKPLVPTILYHSDGKPAVNGNSFEIDNDGGGVVTGTVAGTAGTAVALVGGAGREWWVDGRNYPPQSSSNATGGDGAGWRMEVAAARKVKEAQFVTFLAVDDAAQRQRCGAVRIVTGAGYAGALVDGNLFLIATAPSPAGDLRLDGPEFTGVRQIYLGGLPAGACAVLLNGKKVSAEALELAVPMQSGRLAAF